MTGGGYNANGWPTQGSASSSNPFTAMHQWTTQQATQNAQAQNAGAAAGGYSPVNHTYGATGAPINNPEVNPNAYQYGGQAGGASAFNQQLAQQSAAQQATQGAQIVNPYDQRDQSQVQGTLGQLGNFYTGQLNGTGPSLAATQAQQAMQQSIAAQMAAANSSRGGLGNAAGQMAAAQQAGAAQANAAQQSVQGRIQEEYNAAQGMQGVGQLSLGEQQANMQNAQMQAQLQEQQQLENAKLGLGYSGLENQVNTEQLNAQMAQQAQMSGNYLGASGMGMNQSQFNTTNNENLAMGGLGAAAGLMMAFGDADFVEPSFGTGRKGGQHNYADMSMQPPARLTLREERPVDTQPFLVLADQNNRTIGRVETKPLNAREAARVDEPHGAGPIFARGDARAHTTVHDLPMAMPASTLGPRGQMLALMPGGGGQMAQQPRPAPGGGGMTAPMRPMPVAQMPMARPFADMDFARTKQTYHDASLSDPNLQNLDWGASSDPRQGGTLLDQLRAREQSDLGGVPMTSAQRQFYGPGAIQPQGMTSDQAAQAFGGNGPSPIAANAGRAIGGNYGMGWDMSRPPAAAPATQQGASKLHDAGMDLMKQSIGRIGGTQPTAPQMPIGYAPSFQPMAVPALPQFSDMDMAAAAPVLRQRYAPQVVTAGVDGLRARMQHLETVGRTPALPTRAQVTRESVYADMDLGPRLPTYGQVTPESVYHDAKLGSGARFSHLEHSLAGKGAKDPGALAAYIGREKYGAKKMGKLAAKGRK